MATAASLTQTGTDTTTNTLAALYGYLRQETEYSDAFLFSFDANEVVNLVDHAANCWSIFHFNSVSDATQTQTT